MNKTCAKWRDQLLEAALGEKPGNELDAHLAQCGDCAAELVRLRARRDHMDALLPLIGSAEPAADLTNRILAAATPAAVRQSAFVWWRWPLSAAVAVVVIVLMTGWILTRPKALGPAPPGTIALAHWQAPTDVLLQVPNRELLNSVPKLDDSYLQIPMEMQKGEKQ